jgi:hypothetical protein
VSRIIPAVSDSNDPGIGRDCHVLLARDQYAQKNLRMTSEKR